MSKAHKVLEQGFWNDPEGHKQRVLKKTLQDLLLDNEPVLAHGRLWDIHYEHLDLGIYIIWLEKRGA